MVHLHRQTSSSNFPSSFNIPTTPSLPSNAQSLPAKLLPPTKSSHNNNTSPTLPPNPSRSHNVQHRHHKPRTKPTPSAGWGKSIPTTFLPSTQPPSTPKRHQP